MIDKYLPYSNLHVSSKKEKDALLRDMIYSLHRFGFSYEEYFIFKVYHLNTLGRESFDNLKMHYGYCDLVNGDTVRDMFEDKWKCFEAFRKFYKRDLIVIRNSDQQKEFEAFVQKHSSFIVKPYNGHSGIGIHIVREIRSSDVQKQFETELSNGAFVAEELVEQGNAMAILHPESINTLRIVTFRNKDKVSFIGAALRIGTGRSSVDNAGSGGIYANIDIDKGFVDSAARNNLGQRYSVQPDTGIKIPGFEIPDWKSALEMATDMAKVVETATMIAWDLAYGKQGWLMIEGNDVGEPYLFQAQYQTGKKHLILSLLDEYFKENN